MLCLTNTLPTTKHRLLDRIHKMFYSRQINIELSNSRVSVDMMNLSRLIHLRVFYESIHIGFYTMVAMWWHIVLPSANVLTSQQMLKKWHNTSK